MNLDIDCIVVYRVVCMYREINKEWLLIFHAVVNTQNDWYISAIFVCSGINKYDYICNFALIEISKWYWMQGSELPTTNNGQNNHCKEKKSSTVVFFLKYNIRRKFWLCFVYN